MNILQCLLEVSEERNCKSGKLLRSISHNIWWSDRQ